MDIITEQLQSKDHRFTFHFTFRTLKWHPNFILKLVTRKPRKKTRNPSYQIIAEKKKQIKKR